MKNTTTRRAFIKSTAAASAAVIVPRHVLGGPGYRAPSDTLVIAGVGVGGMGRVYLENVASENIAVLCDVDHGYAKRTFDIYPDAVTYYDYRRMLDQETGIDAGVIGGPSAGLAFSLALVDLLGEDDLTGGEVVAASGTIEPDGTVGPVGGITQKVVGALTREGGPPATVFLVPRGNFEAARAAPATSELLLVPVDRIDDAVAALRDLREGRVPAEAFALGTGS